MSHKKLLQYLKQHEEANKSHEEVYVEPEQDVPVQQTVGSEADPVEEVIDTLPNVQSLSDKVSKLKNAASKIKRPKKNLNNKNNKVIELW